MPVLAIEDGDCKKDIVVDTVNLNTSILCGSACCQCVSMLRTYRCFLHVWWFRISRQKCCRERRDRLTTTVIVNIISPSSMSILLLLPSPPFCLHFHQQLFAINFPLVCVCAIVQTANEMSRFVPQRENNGNGSCDLEIGENWKLSRTLWYQFNTNMYRMDTGQHWRWQRSVLDVVHFFRLGNLRRRSKALFMAYLNFLYSKWREAERFCAHMMLAISINSEHLPEFKTGCLQFNWSENNNSRITTCANNHLIQMDVPSLISKSLCLLGIGNEKETHFLHEQCMYPMSAP